MRTFKSKIWGVICMVALLVCCTMTLGGVTAFAASPDTCSHDYVPTVVPATCTEKGYTLYECSLCGETYKANITSETGHSFSSVTEPPTCTHRGFTTYFCKNCGYEYTDNYTDALGHVYTEGSYGFGGFGGRVKLYPQIVKLFSE